VGSDSENDPDRGDGKRCGSVAGAGSRAEGCEHEKRQNGQRSDDLDGRVLMDVRCEDSHCEADGCGGEWSSTEAKTLYGLLGRDACLHRFGRQRDPSKAMIYEFSVF
jgi:hypothetical protein